MTVSKKKIVGILLIGCMSSMCLAMVNGPYMGQEPPGMKPEIFSPGFICLEDRYEYGFAFSPDGKEFAFTLTNSTWGYFELLYTAMDQNGQWSEPHRPEFVGDRIQSLYPFFTPDGNKVFFASPLYQGSPWDSDIFFSERTENGWSEPINMGSPVNSTGMEFRLSITDDGTLYFLSNREGNGNIYRCPLEDGVYANVEKLGDPINTTGPEGSPFIAPDESYLIFESGRAGGYGQNDLYISFRNEDGSWSRAMNLGPAVNTNAIEDGGSITRDGKYFLFCQRVAYTTNIPTDILWIDACAVLPEPNGPIRNLTTGQTFGSIQCAVNYALPGETIVVEPGSYKESVVIDKDIVVKSIDPNDPFYVGGTMIQGDPNEPVVTLNNNTAACTLAGLTLRGGSVGISGTATYAAIRNCHIIDNVGHGIDLIGASPHLSGCLITANGGNGVNMQPQSVTTGTGRQTRTTEISCQPVIENCTIIDNGEEALEGGEPEIIDSIIEEKMEITWQLKTPLPIAHMSCHAVSCNGKIYHVGGQKNSGDRWLRSNLVYEYDPMNDEWTSKSSMPTGRWNFALVTVDKKVYAIGGDTFLNKNEMYDPATDTWTTLAPMPTRSQHIKGVTVGGKIYIIGGLESWSKVLDKNQVYDPQTDTWEEKTPIPIPKHNYAAAVYNEKIYIFGGDTQNGSNIWANTSSIEVYDPASDSWEILPDMLVERFNPGIAVIQNKIVIIGGFIGDSVTNRIYIFDPATNIWTESTPLPQQNVAMGSTEYDGKIYIIGGSGGPNTAPNGKWNQYDTVYEGVVISSTRHE